MTILRKYNDVIIDNMSPTGFSITIEGDDPDVFYHNLVEEIERDVYAYRAERGGIPAQGNVVKG